MYQYCSHILKFKDSENHSFDSRVTKMPPNARNIKHARTMLQENVDILKEDGMHPNPSTL